MAFEGPYPTKFSGHTPAMVISPYAKRGFIDNSQLSSDSYLQFIEDDFLAGSRIDPETDGRPDSRPDVGDNIAGSILGDFNFNQKPRPPLVLTPPIANPQ